MSLWMMMPELCRCGGTATLRVVEHSSLVENDPDEHDGWKHADWLQYQCPTCGRAGAECSTERAAAETFKRTP